MAIIPDKETDDNPNPRQIMVIYGRNLKARDSLFDFLRALKLEPLEWNELIKGTGKGAPFIGEVLTAGFKRAQAALVLFTPDDVVRLRKELWAVDDGIEETEWSGQPRQNVLIEAGMALGLYPDRTIFVQLGQIRPASDLAGRHIIKLSNEPKSRNALAERLKTAGCTVNTNGEDWYNAGDFNFKFVPPASPIDESPSILQSYLVALHFAKLIHHHFHVLYYQGFQKIGTSARTLYRQQSGGNQPELVKYCEDGWSESEYMQKEIKKNIFGGRKKQLISNVDNAFNVLWTIELNTAPNIASSYGAFDTIKDNLDQYQKQVTIVLNFFNRDGHLSIDKITQFSKAAMDLMMTTERLISNADTMIKGLIEALQVDTRL